MGIIVLLLLLSISIAGIFLVAFLWNVKSGQYDDEQSPAFRILFDHIKETKKSEPSVHSENSDSCS